MDRTQVIAESLLGVLLVATLVGIVVALFTVADTLPLVATFIGLGAACSALIAAVVADLRTVTS